MLMLLDERFRKWLSPLSETILASVWGAMGHHRKFDESTTPEQRAALTVHVAHEDFSQILADMNASLGLSAPPQFERDLVIARDGREICDLQAREAIRDLQEDFMDREAEFADEGERRMLALVKAFGIAADVAASAVAAKGQWSRDYSLTDYVTESLAIGLKPTDLSRLINKWAWDRSRCGGASHDETLLPPDFIVRDFQNEVAESISFLTLAQAGCGSGKSLAAYMWASGVKNWSMMVAETSASIFVCRRQARRLNTSRIMRLNQGLMRA
jgi:CRISPR-associated endonuclease/helicase Cas3